jgi:hypothetical protein
MARHNQGQGGGRRDYNPQRDHRHNARPRQPQQRMPEPIDPQYYEAAHQHDANETELATYLTIRAQNIELLGLAAKIAGCADPKQLLTDVDAEANMRRLEEIYVTLADWVDPDEADDDIEE